MSDPAGAARLTVELTPRIQEGIGVVYPGDYLVRWVLVGEVIDAASGERAFVAATHEDASPVEIVGLLQHGLHREAAQVVAKALNED